MPIDTLSGHFYAHGKMRLRMTYNILGTIEDKSMKFYLEI